MLRIRRKGGTDMFLGINIMQAALNSTYRNNKPENILFSRSENKAK